MEMGKEKKKGEEKVWVHPTVLPTGDA